MIIVVIINVVVGIIVYFIEVTVLYVWILKSRDYFWFIKIKSFLLMLRVLLMLLILKIYLWLVIHFTLKNYLLLVAWMMYESIVDYISGYLNQVPRSLDLTLTILLPRVYFFYIKQLFVLFVSLPLSKLFCIKLYWRSFSPDYWFFFT